MTEIAKYLTGVKAKHGIKSTLQLALQLGVSQPSVTKILMGAQIPSDDVCKKIAKFAGDDPDMVLTMAQVDRAPESTKSNWENIFQIVRKYKKELALAASLCVAVFFTVTPYSLAFSFENTLDRIYYVNFAVKLIVTFFITKDTFSLFKDTIKNRFA